MFDFIVGSLYGAPDLCRFLRIARCSTSSGLRFGIFQTICRLNSSVCSRCAFICIFEPCMYVSMHGRKCLLFNGWR